MENIDLVSINGILDKAFFIPDYQRGYRWEKQQVEDLLDDLKEFYDNSRENNERVYCIQPLVVKYDSDQNRYNVIDGQQRLTTIKILILCLNKEEKTYSVEYQTRAGSAEFLNSITKQCDNCCAENSDYYHMFHAKECIFKWLNKHTDEFKESFLKMIKEKVNFVWYESDEPDSIKVFTRLNIGKIGLTESELIKALFLSSNNFSSDTTDEDELMTLVEIANEWDKIESRLQDDRFWLFFHKAEYNKPTRIDYILDIVRQMDPSNDKHYDGDAHPTFRFFYDKFKDSDNKQKYLTDQWGIISNIYQIVEEWYSDEELYHYIGYLCTFSDDSEVFDLIMKFKGIKECKIKRKSYNSETKDEFINYLKAKIKDKCFTYMDFDLEYEGDNPDKKLTKCVFLLHNIQTVLDQNASIIEEKKYSLPDFVRFPFHLYKKEGWDVEHIRPSSLEDFEGERKESARKKYIFVLEQYQNQNKHVQEALRDYYNKIEQSDKDESVEAFKQLWNSVNDNNNNELSEAQKNQIWNYVLLDASTNREYGNSCFAIKREYVLKKEKGIKPELRIVENKVELIEKNEAAFVPICTKNVFSKSYTDYPSDLQFWTEKDAAFYRFDIEKSLWWYMFDKLDEELESPNERYKLFKEYKENIIDKEIYDTTFKSWYEKKKGKKTDEQ